MDEIALKNQSLLYNILDWPRRGVARLIVIGIANTFDLMDRQLPRLVSRSGMLNIERGRGCALWSCIDSFLLSPLFFFPSDFLSCLLLLGGLVGYNRHVDIIRLSFQPYNHNQIQKIGEYLYMYVDFFL